MLSPELNVPSAELKQHLQLVQVESADALPMPKPWPAGHLVNVHGLHTPPTSHDPVEHAPAHAASLLAVPAVNGAPPEHVGVECAVHAV